MALSHPAVRTHIRQQLCVVEQMHAKPDMIAGWPPGASPGAPMSPTSWAAFCYVRGEAKVHGKGNRVEETWAMPAMWW